MPRRPPCVVRPKPRATAPRDAVGWLIEPTIVLTGDLSLEAVHDLMDDIRRVVACHSAVVTGVDCGLVNEQGHPALRPR